MASTSTSPSDDASSSLSPPAPNSKPRSSAAPASPMAVSLMVTCGGSAPSAFSCRASSAEYLRMTSPFASSNSAAGRRERQREREGSEVERHRREYGAAA